MARSERWEMKMGRSGPRRPTLMDNAYSRPLKPGEVQDDFEDEKIYQKAPSPPRVKFTSEPAAALKLIDTEHGRGCGTCLAPLPYRAADDSVMNPFAQPWSPPQAAQSCQTYQPIGVIQPQVQPVQMQQMPQMQQGMPQPLMQPSVPYQQPAMNGTMPCFYAQPVVGYTTMAPMQTIPQQPMAQMAQPMAQPMTQPMTQPMAQPMAQPMQPAMAQAVPAVPMVMVNEVPKEPRLGSPQLPSKGSALHAYRACKPCAFFYQEGCSNKEQCAFCHLCEPGERKRRKKERRMAR